MKKAYTLLRKGRKAIQKSDLFSVLRSEIVHELSFDRFEHESNGSLGRFIVDWDSTWSQDVLLRNKCESGEEIAVSAKLGDEFSRESVLCREVLMKVCVKKPGLSSFLQFDCGVTQTYEGVHEFDIRNAFYLQSTSCIGSSAYKGPSFCTLDHDLQDALKDYLQAKGIEESFTRFLLYHLHKKEQSQYVNWLHKLEDFAANKVKSEESEQGQI